MSRDRKLPPHEAWDAVEKTAIEQEAARVHELSDQALDEELAARKIDPKALRDRGEAFAAQLAARSSRRNDALPARAEARDHPHARWVWLAPAAVFAVLIGLALLNAASVVAWFEPSHEPVGPDIARDAALAPTPFERAAKLREQALAACDQELWSACKEGLDEAQRLDPAGEGDVRVQQARDDIYIAQRSDGGVIDWKNEKKEPKKK
jgi:hypothetical protein